MTQELRKLAEAVRDAKTHNELVLAQTKLDDSLTSRQLLELLDRLEKAEKDAARLAHLMDYWLHSMARMLGVGFGNYTSNEDTRKKALEVIDSAMEASK